MTVAFVISSLILTQIARRLGWFLSRRYLYVTSAPFCVVASIAWGSVTALLMFGLIEWLHPHWLLKWIFGYAQGAYAAEPTFGLFAESTVPAHARARHEIISTVPLVTFIGSMIVLAVLW